MVNGPRSPHVENFLPQTMPRKLTMDPRFQLTSDDIVVVNAGFHYLFAGLNVVNNETVLERDVRKLLAVLRAVPGAKRPRLIWRERSAQGFPSDPYGMHRQGCHICKCRKMQPRRGSWRKLMFLYFAFIGWPR